MPTSVFHKDLLVTNLQKIKRYKFILHCIAPKLKFSNQSYCIFILNIWNTYLSFSWKLTSYKFTKNHKVQIYYILYSSKALIFKPDLLCFYLKFLGSILGQGFTYGQKWAHEIWNWHTKFYSFANLFYTYV